MNWWGAILALGFAGGFLAKGPEALLPIVPIFLSARWMGWRGVASFLLILALGLLLVSLWAIPACAQTPAPIGAKAWGTMWATGW